MMTEEGTDATLKIAIIVGTTRPGRKAAQVVEWAYQIARIRTDAAFIILDLATFELPILDEPLPAPSGSYENPHTKAWSAAIASFDGFVFVTSESATTAPRVR
jgi:NAD(P)H-dependent FMN reductase